MVTVSNNSEKIIYAVPFALEYIAQEVDTTLSERHVRDTEYYIFNPNITKKVALDGFTHHGRDCIEDVVKQNGQVIVRVFILDSDILDHFTWNTIVNDYMILERYDLNLENLQHLNWTITYPPDERMKNVKMYPPYQE
jgi:hypothetical protein